MVFSRVHVGVDECVWYSAFHDNFHGPVIDWVDVHDFVEVFVFNHNCYTRVGMRACFAFISAIVYCVVLSFFGFCDVEVSFL